MRPQTADIKWFVYPTLFLGLLYSKLIYDELKRDSFLWLKAKANIESNLAPSTIQQFFVFCRFLIIRVEWGPCPLCKPSQILTSTHLLVSSSLHTLYTHIYHPCKPAVLPVNHDSCTQLDWQSLKVRFKCEFTRPPALPGYHCKVLSPALAVPAHLSCARCLSHAAMFPASHPASLPSLISTH